MDVRTIENRLREIAGGADMISMKGVLKYTGTSPEWIIDRFRDVGISGVGNAKGRRYHVRDVALALAPDETAV